ncbi:MAG: hypothetical protein RIF33_10100 [Cyclobacteriaceae bacterium]
MIRFLRNLILIFLKINKLERQVDSAKILTANLLSANNLLNQSKINEDIKLAEFKVFSQWGDDGIIQYLVDYLQIKHKTFIEFGVENYKESNTRFLLINNYWKGLIYDGSQRNINEIMRDEIYWKYDLAAESQFITKENINDHIEDSGFKGEIGILSIDIDGNDYWVWKEIDIVDPIIVIVEYNPVFGLDKAITVPYDPEFNRTKAHHSNLYFGASLRALCMLAEDKGYSFLGCTRSGNNAYYIKSGHESGLSIKSPEEGFVISGSRESRDEQGNLDFISGDDRLKKITGMKVYNVHTDEIELL